jgi:hypothetical protein
MNALKKYWTDPSVLIGWFGTAIYWVMQNFEAVAGMIFAVVMIGSSIAMHFQKMKNLENEDRRKEELHRLNIKNLTNDGTTTKQQKDQ